MASRTERMTVGLLLLALAGCGGGGDGFFTAGPSGGSAFGNLIAFNTTNPGPAPAAAAVNAEPALECPTVEVLDGTSSMRSFGGTDQSNSNVRYQYSMGEVARECSRAGSQILIKIGVEGRVLLGPAGAPGSFNVPVRIAVRRDRDQKPVAAKLYQVPTTVAPGETAGDFTLVSDPLSVPYVQAHSQEDYTILVGFDSQGQSAAPAARKKARGSKPAPG